MEKAIEYEWERVSQSAWDYCHFEDTESWAVIIHAVGTAGNLDITVYGREVHDADGNVEYWPETDDQGRFFGVQEDDF